MRSQWVKWAIAAAGVAVVLAVGVPFLYIHLIEGPAAAPLALKQGSEAPAAGGPIAGTWRTSTGSVVGYRVNEVLVGQNNVAVGRSESVTGHLVISGMTVTSAAFAVPIASIHSDQSERDVQFDGRIMDAASFPTGTFTLSKPIALAPLPANAVVKIVLEFLLDFTKAS